MWHINNEYGCHVSHCYCETQRATRSGAWLAGSLRRRSTRSTRLGHERSGRSATGVRRGAAAAQARRTFGNPGQLLDFDRFTRDTLLERLPCRSGDLVRAATPMHPDHHELHGLLQGRRLLGVGAATSTSSPTTRTPTRPTRVAPVYAAMPARPHAVARARRQPWMLMEQAPSAVNWRPSNAPKAPGPDGRPRSQQAIARGADGILFFQWRQSRGRRREVPLGDAAARGHRHAGVARGHRARRRPRRPRGPRGQPRRCPGRDRLRLG